MKVLRILSVFLPAFAALGADAYSQTTDTTGIYSDRQDTLKATVFSAKAQSNFLKRSTALRTETITAAGLCKMACCNLSESFENSASVSVGYSDAVTGARQIRLLGQSGIYTQMLDENRPVMRGLSAPFGLNYVPGQWLESIQIAKGVGSVLNGVESMTGQINMEHRKPTDEKPLYVQASLMNDTKADLNVISALQMDELMTWSTVIFGHIDGNFKQFDHNGDGFYDDPKNLQVSFGNRWHYTPISGPSVKFGFNAVMDNRKGGQSSTVENPWTTDIANKNLDVFAKLGIPLDEGRTNSVAFIADYSFQKMDSRFATTGFNATQHSVFLNALYQQEINDYHKFTVGICDMFDSFDESLKRVIPAASSAADSRNRFNEFAMFGEYTFQAGDVVTAVAGLRGEKYSEAGWKFVPRLTLKFSPIEEIVIRGNFGRGLRRAMPLVDNIGILSTSKLIDCNSSLRHLMEDSWTYGGNVTWYIGNSSTTYLSLDWFGTDFKEQTVINDTPGSIDIVALSSMKGAKSYTNNYQVDFNMEPFTGFTTTLTFRYTDAKQTLPGVGLVEKPMTSRYKGVLNLQYSAPLNKWIIDFTASINGPCRVWDFMADRYPTLQTPVYHLLYAQITRRLKGVDIYIGGENLTNFRQKDPIISADNPWASSFDASCIWGPLMGIKIYAGVRVTIWKTV